MSTVTQEFVRELIDFAPTEQTKKQGFAEYQLDGTVAAYNMLQRNRCAYLADEVGMGKTYVALGVMALVRHFDPHARIIVIAPRENIQRKWIKELKNFVRHNWRVVGNRVKSLQGEPAWEPVLCNSLVDFAHEALLNADRDFFLRMTSFSLALKQVDNRRRLRKLLRQQVPWIDKKALSSKSAEGFRWGFGRALNAVVPTADLVIVDEAHNLKHGYREHGSIRNHVMGLAFGHPSGQDEACPWYVPKAKRLLFLSATPFEEDYSAIQRQFEIFGFGDAELHAANGAAPVRMGTLCDSSVSEDEKRGIVGRLMLRRVSGLQINGELHTKNMYRREWRSGGYKQHDQPMHIEDPRQRLIVALMQKKVAEVLQDEKFNNNFQIGMLSSFESFLQTVDTTAKQKKPEADIGTEEDDESPSTFDGDQTRDDRERRGVDTHAISQVSESFRERFNRSLPHPKLDRTAEALTRAFRTGEKTLVFVRRVATVNELAAKLDRVFDRWIRSRMDDALPELATEVGELFHRYERERRRRPEDQIEEFPLDQAESDEDEAAEYREFVDEDDEGSAETFFAWFFRGTGPSGVLSGAAFQKNRLGSTSSVYATLFEDDHVSWLLGRPEDPIGALASAVKKTREQVIETLRSWGYALFRERSRQKEGYPRLYVFEAYQSAALEMLAGADGELAERARIVRQERHPGQSAPREGTVPAGFPGPEDSIGATTFITELVKHEALRNSIWPDETRQDFRQSFRRREQRRELLSAMGRLGASYIDLYLLAIKSLGGFALRREAEVQRPEQQLARDYVGLLERQMGEPGFHAYYEMSHAAAAFDLLLAVNFHEVQAKELPEIAGIYGATLQRQVPVGRMSGGVNKRLVRQFRMPGFPLVLATTDVLQEGEDLHTFCRRVVHYGITWTPSAMEQRTGRIDRIGSLVQRALDGTSTIPDPEELIQVFYPHLGDTVEVLQVRRVLRRLNRFLRLIHDAGQVNQAAGSRIDTARAILEELEHIAPIEGPLKSAFPVQDGWLVGSLNDSDVRRPDVEGKLAHLGRLWAELVREFEIREAEVDGRNCRGVALVSGDRLARANSSTPSGEDQAFRLELRSQAAGDATLLRCRSHVHELDLSDDEMLDALYELQKELGMVKVCVQPDARGHRQLVSVEGGILFDPRTTQFEELSALVTRIVRSASRARRALDVETPPRPCRRRRAAG
ncbi:MAG: DEAD/DEAH box helicase [bacterium]|nr:DEAD/DEAH box helicase [bacterium]